MSAWHTVNQAQLQQLLNGRNGAVVKDMIKRLLRVEAAAKKNLDNDPRRIDTGRLRTSIRYELKIAHTVIGRVGTNVKYARWVHDGTGIYGPHSTRIYPKTKKALKWKSGTHGTSKGGYVFAKYTLGMRPNRFLRNAMKAAKTG